MEKPLEPWATWEACAGDSAAQAMTRMAESLPQYFADSTTIDSRCARLPFYRRFRLIEVRFVRAGEPERAFLLDGEGETHWLDGTSPPIHQTNATEPLKLTNDTVLDYVRFFLFFLRADEGAFMLVESPKEITAAEHDDAWFEQFQGKLDFEVAALWTHLANARSRVIPLEIEKVDEDGRWIVKGSVVYGGRLALVTFAVAPHGAIEMLDDQSFDSLDKLAYPTAADLDLYLNPEATQEPGDEDHDEEEEEKPEPARPSGPTRTLRPGKGQSARYLKELLGTDEKLPRDREVNQVVVATLLEDAVRERESALLLRQFNSETEADKPIERLARLAAESDPIIVVESDIPFVEDFVADLIDGNDNRVSGGLIQRATVIDGDDLRCSLNFRNEHAKLFLLSFHAYRGLHDVERAAHELAIRDATVIIGCDRLADVPEPLRRVTDLVLTFPRLDRKLFGRIFERVFHTKPTPGWDGPGTDWTRYLVPADFHSPRRLGLSPDEALAFLKDRVEARLRQVTPMTGPTLAELHGLGEARQISEDVIADIRAAQSGEIPWSAVDRGLLLVGPPGTGKTTLARAIAKECGIKFIAASAARWQSAGALDAHLRAMRADFTEARRYAPAILFLDEIDSIGNREQLTGPVTQYQTEVINSLLEQIQGIASTEPVIVIAATNYAEKVDPALRRAGRLDQVVNIPLPNIVSLEEIFRYYLKPHRAESRVGPDVNERALAELAFGLTGADVEFFVRGAARRARRAQQPISQADLLAEVTRRPRRQENAPRLGVEAIRRVAVHEAGHTIARLVSSTQGADITFVTIIPRLDGSLGFVASLPPDGALLTRRTMLERLEMILGGRAAEEVVYGTDHVGLGAGGGSERSDLAVATSLATMLVCQSGLGDDGGLHWTPNPTPAQEKQIDGLLRKAYSGVVARIQSNRPLLDRIVDALVARQEMSGAELRQMLSSAPPA
jgi:hypothetical protein